MPSLTGQTLPAGINPGHPDLTRHTRPLNHTNTPFIDMTAELKNKIVEIALSQVGVREQGNNQGPEIVMYQKATWLEPGAWPWCAAFTAWVLEQASKTAGAAVKLCKDASAYGWEKHGKKNGWQVLDETQPAQPGDFVTFDFSHIGVVVADNGATIETVEGNTNHKGERESESGDGVWRKTRHRSLVKSFIRVA